MHFSVNISGKKVGLLGGSFNPAHEGHLAIAQKALEMGLDYVIWLVVPQNPLKPPYEMSLEERVKSAEGVCRLALNCHPGLDPGSSVLTNNAILKELGPHFRGDDEECRDDNVDRIIISSLEEEIHSANTYDTLTYLTKHFPDTKFVWLMGVDCLDQFHLWENYDKFTNLVDIIIFNRPGYTHLLEDSVAGKMLAAKTCEKYQSGVCFVKEELSGISSTEIRKGVEK